MRSTKLLSTTQRLDRNGLADLLSVLAERVRGGQVILASGADTLTLDLPAQVKVDIDVESKPRRVGTKMELEIEIEWTEGVDGDGGPKTLTLPEPA